MLRRRRQHSAGRELRRRPHGHLATGFAALQPCSLFCDPPPPPPHLPAHLMLAAQDASPQRRHPTAAVAAQKACGWQAFLSSPGAPDPHKPSNTSDGSSSRPSTQAVGTLIWPCTTRQSAAARRTTGEAAPCMGGLQVTPASRQACALTSSVCTVCTVTAQPPTKAKSHARCRGAARCPLLGHRLHQRAVGGHSGAPLQEQAQPARAARSQRLRCSRGAGAAPHR